MFWLLYFQIFMLAIDYSFIPSSPLSTVCSEDPNAPRLKVFGKTTYPQCSSMSVHCDDLDLADLDGHEFRRASTLREESTIIDDIAEVDTADEQSWINEDNKSFTLSLIKYFPNELNGWIVDIGSIGKGIVIGHRK